MKLERFWIQSWGGDVESVRRAALTGAEGCEILCRCAVGTRDNKTSDHDEI